MIGKLLSEILKESILTRSTYFFNHKMFIVGNEVFAMGEVGTEHYTKVTIGAITQDFITKRTSAIKTIKAKTLAKYSHKYIIINNEFKKVIGAPPGNTVDQILHFKEILETKYKSLSIEHQEMESWKPMIVVAAGHTRVIVSTRYSNIANFDYKKLIASFYNIKDERPEYLLMAHLKAIAIYFKLKIDKWTNLKDMEKIFKNLDIKKVMIKRLMYNINNRKEN